MEVEDVMELTKEQLESAQKGEVVRIQTDGGEIVIVKAEFSAHSPGYPATRGGC